MEQSVIPFSFCVHFDDEKLKYFEYVHWNVVMQNLNNEFLIYWNILLRTPTVPIIQIYYIQMNIGFLFSFGAEKGKCEHWSIKKNHSIDTFFLTVLLNLRTHTLDIHRILITSFITVWRLFYDLFCTILFTQKFGYVCMKSIYNNSNGIYFLYHVLYIYKYTRARIHSFIHNKLLIHWIEYYIV